jgi:flavin reductase (DIM6/NTAB) family NADH-FMN oxidoreductase RutF
MQSVEKKIPALTILPYHSFATTVTLITAYYESQPNVMTCEWTMIVCREPLRIMMVIKKSDLTHELVERSREFGVNVCSDQQSALSHLAGSSSGKQSHKLAHPLFLNMTYQAETIHVPMIRDCVLNAECVVERTIDMDEYTAFVGLARRVTTNAEFTPLLYYQGRYARLGDWLPRPLCEHE